MSNNDYNEFGVNDDTLMDELRRMEVMGSVSLHDNGRKNEDKDISREIRELWGDEDIDSSKEQDEKPKTR